MINARRLICSGIVAVLVAGCSTPASRIEKHLDVFNTFPLEAQALIRQGKIDIGFTPDMVRIALGDPSREYNRKSADAESEVWSYVDYNYSTERQRADVNVPVYDAGDAAPAGTNRSGWTSRNPKNTKNCASNSKTAK